MSQILIGVVDYGVGNHASVTNALRNLGFKVRVSCNIEELSQVDLLLLPGVGAFSAAMAGLHERGLVSFLRGYANEGRPLIGICLGMQLLATTSYEFGETAGLNLIPGEIIPFPNNTIHIGWDTVKISQSESLCAESNGDAFYFNHSLYYSGRQEYQVALSEYPIQFSSVIRSGSVFGIQFHPEKSQLAGRMLLKRLIRGLVSD